MVARKLRVPVVLDTNVFVCHLLSQKRRGQNSLVVRLWLVRGLVQLIVSESAISEYLRLFEEKVGMDGKQLRLWRNRLEKDSHCTLVNPGPRPKMSRDPDDNIFIATALAGRAEYLITNDRDLLELPEGFKADLPFEIVTPREFLARFKA